MLLDGLILSLWLAVIGVCLHFGRAIGTWLESGSGQALELLLMVCAIAAVWVAGRRVASLPADQRPSALVGLTAVAAEVCVMVYCLPQLIEQTHIPLYGVLGVLAFRYFSHRWRGLAHLWTSTTFCVIVGATDEIIQHYHPERWGDVRDVVINVASSVVGVTAAAVVEPRTN